MSILLLAVALAGAPAVAPDTLVQVSQGDHLVLRDFSGAVQVEGWDRSEVRAGSDEVETLAFRFTRSGRRLELQVLDRKNRNRTEELRLRVPAWMGLEVSGSKLDVEARGLGGEVRIRSLKGDLHLDGLSGRVEALTVDGSIHATGLQGTVYLKAGSDDVTVLRSGGSLKLETVSGDIEILGSTATQVEALTMDGDIDFGGGLRPGGSYSFRSHGGGLTMHLASPVNADVRVLVYEGEFESDFPIRTRGFRSGQELEFTVGEGGARLLLEAFDGEVALRRAGNGR